MDKFNESKPLEPKPPTIEGLEAEKQKLLSEQQMLKDRKAKLENKKAKLSEEVKKGKEDVATKEDKKPGVTTEKEEKGKPRPKPEPTIENKNLEKLKSTNDEKREEYFNLLKNKPKKVGWKQYKEDLQPNSVIYLTALQNYVKELEKTDKSKAIEFLTSAIEEKRNIEMSGFGKVTEGANNGIEMWDKWGTDHINKNGEKVKGHWWQRTIKTIASISAIGGSALLTGKLANFEGITNVLKESGATSVMGKRLAIGLGISTLIESVSHEHKKKLQGLVTALGLGVAAFGGGILVVAGATAVGYGSSKLLHSQFFSEEGMEKRREETKGKINFENISEFEKEYTKILNNQKWKRIGGVALRSATALVASTATMNFLHASSHETSTETEKINNSEQTFKEAEAKANETLKLDDSGKTIITEKSEAITETPSQTEKISVNPDAIVHKGEGITHAFAEQIRNDPGLAKSLGFEGDINDKHDMALFTRKLAIDTGYMDESGHEVRVAHADKVAYELSVDEKGGIVVNEKTIDGTLQETHHSGDKFEPNTKDGIEKEYEHNTDKEYHYKDGQEVNHDTDNGKSQEISTTPKETDQTKSEEVVKDIDKLENEDEKPTEKIGKKWFDFGDRKDNTVRLFSKDGNTKMSMQFFYDKNDNITHVDIVDNKNYSSTDFVGINKWRNEDAITDAIKEERREHRFLWSAKDYKNQMNEEISKAFITNKFLEKVGIETYEGEFLQKELVGMQKQILNEYGPVIERDALQPEVRELWHQDNYEFSKEEIEKINTVKNENIEKVFPGYYIKTADTDIELHNKQIIWDNILNGVNRGETLTANQILNMNINVANEEMQPLIYYFDKLHEETRLEPYKDEIPKDYIDRCLTEAANNKDLKGVTLTEEEMEKYQLLETKKFEYENRNNKNFNEYKVPENKEEESDYKYHTPSKKPSTSDGVYYNPKNNN